jgi:hypothetical protein
MTPTAAALLILSSRRSCRLCRNVPVRREADQRREADRHYGSTSHRPMVGHCLSPSARREGMPHIIRLSLKMRHHRSVGGRQREGVNAMPKWSEDGVLKLRCDVCRETEAAYDMEGNWDESRMAQVQAEEDGWVLKKKGEAICPNCAPSSGGYSLRVP